MNNLQVVQDSWQHVVGYDWRTVAVPTLGQWQPTQTISVVLPAFNCQEQLERTVAALAKQRYPSTLLEVLIVDDGSDEHLTMPEITPENTKLLRFEREVEWGRARARHAGAMAAGGEILLFLDADMVTHPDHVAAHARWHHVLRDAVTLGHKLFVDFGGITAEQVYEAAADDRLFELVADRPHQEHEWVERLIQRTDELTVYWPKMFLAAVGATVGMRADLYRETGGFRMHLHRGEDMEMGYRLMTAGAVFIPERQARSWHQGPAAFMTRADEVRRSSQPHFANYVPVPGGFRPWTPGRHYAVPMVDVIVEVADSYEETKTCVDAILSSGETDLRVDLWGSASKDCLDLLHAEYHADPRVQLLTEAPVTGFPSRFTMFLPAWAGLRSDSLVTMLGIVEQSGTGALRVAVPGANDTDVVLWRTAALQRARRAAPDAGNVGAISRNLFGESTVTAAEVGVVDLRHTAMPAKPRTQPSVQVALERLALATEELKDLRRRHRRLRARFDALMRASTQSGPERRTTGEKPSLPIIRRLFVR